MRELAAFLLAKGRVALHTVASVRRQSKLKVAFITSFAVALWLGLFLGTRFTFQMLGLFAGEAFGGEGELVLGSLLMGRLLALLALVLFVMLVASNVLTSFSTLYRSREMPLLLISPLPMPALFLGRFSESLVFSSWASAYLGSPLLLAYGLVANAPLAFYLSLLAFYLPFVTLAASLGAIFAMGFVRALAWLPRWALALAGGGGVLAFFAIFRHRLRPPDLAEAGTLQAITETIGRTQSPFLPSQWLSQGILAAAGGNWGQAGYDFLLLLANAALFLWLATLAAELWLFDGYSALAGGGSGAAGRRLRRRLSAALDRLLRPLPIQTRVLVGKDLRTFWRDPAQWSQFLIFFGLMALYLANLGRQPSSIDPQLWKGWGTLLNSTASLLILSTLTTRFIYPLISLEGRRIWILGLAPLPRSRILWQKMWLSVAATSFITLGLSVLSARRLGLEGADLLLSVCGMVAATVGLSGLAVGLGSLYPNFDEEHPAKIVAGMGGTLCFLLSLLYILLMAIVQAPIFHWSWLGSLTGLSFSSALGLVLLGVLLLTGLAAALPLALGRRHLERVEF